MQAGRLSGLLGSIASLGSYATNGPDRSGFGTRDDSLPGQDELPACGSQVAALACVALRRGEAASQAVPPCLPAAPCRPDCLHARQRVHHSWLLPPYLPPPLLGYLSLCAALGGCGVRAVGRAGRELKPRMEAMADMGEPLVGCWCWGGPPRLGAPLAVALGCGRALTAAGVPSASRLPASSRRTSSSGHAPLPCRRLAHADAGARLVVRQ